MYLEELDPGVLSRHAELFDVRTRDVLQEVLGGGPDPR
jgi:hypothetical protein